jgi:hypothetical protein
MKRFGRKQNASYAASWTNNMRVRSAFSLTSVGVTGRTINATAATIVVSMTNASSASSATTAVAARTNAMTEKVLPNAKTRITRPVASMASTQSTHTKSAMATRSIKQNCAQATTSAGMKVAIIMTIATQVAMVSCAGARIIPCPATVMQARATRGKLMRIFT